MKKQCLECGEPLQGRVDKRFCGDYCRNTYHNRSNRGASAIIRQVNRVLREAGLESLEPDSVEARHLQIEAMKCAFADVYQHVADAAHMRIEPSALIDPSYLAVGKPVPAGLAALCFVAVAVLRVPLLPALLGLVPFCVLARRWSRS